MTADYFNSAPAKAELAEPATGAGSEYPLERRGYCVAACVVLVEVHEKISFYKYLIVDAVDVVVGVMVRDEIADTLDVSLVKVELF